MKKLLWCCLFIIMAKYSQASTPGKILNNYHKIISLISQDKVVELANYISYPLKRPNPLPDIKTPREFVKYYSVMFDEAFKQKLRYYNDSVIFEHNGQYGLVGGKFSGDMWLNEDGEIASLNYSSLQEQKLKEKITAMQRQIIYPIVNTWTKNIYVARGKHLLLRVDDTKNGFRYVVWNNSPSVSVKPDLVLYNGQQDQQGTMGGWSYTFKNKNWTYVVDDVQLCEVAKNCGLFLKIYNKGALVETQRLTEGK